MLPNWADDDSRTSNAGHNHNNLRRRGHWTIRRAEKAYSGRSSVGVWPVRKPMSSQCQVGMYREVPPPYRFPHWPQSSEGFVQVPSLSFPVAVDCSQVQTGLGVRPTTPSSSSPGRCLCHFGAIASSSTRHRTASLNTNQRTPREKATASTEVWQQPTWCTWLETNGSNGSRCHARSWACSPVADREVGRSTSNTLPFFKRPRARQGSTRRSAPCGCSRDLCRRLGAGHAQIIRTSVVPVPTERW